MSRVQARLDIAAPVEVVFGFFDDLANAAVLVSNLDEVTAVETLPSGGRRVEYTFRDRAGTVHEASSEHVAYDPPRRTVTRNIQSGVVTTMVREFQPVGDATLVTATVEWEIPVRSVAGIISAPLRGPYRRGLRDTLHAAREALTAP
ncbi:MAG TPA: SRPBCC family protein [Acidimicrobiia bacterium]|nr:SRPBCC family protein [Acidimicrobiia bacterium]